MSDSAATETQRLLGELEAGGIRLGLDAMERLLAKLGSPERRLPTVLVAGTNGKGSTAALLHSVLTAAGYRCGLYTSPHLEDVRERIRLSGRAISAEKFAPLLQRVVEVARNEVGELPTYFEALTAAAYVHFADEADIAVFEVGLGGRLDATNVGRPLLSLITEIGLDHTEMLGPSERQIAREKAGVMRPGRPVLVAVTSAAGDELELAAKELGARYVDILQDSRLLSDGGERLAGLRTPASTYRLRLDLAGEHQWRNLALAVRAAEVLRDDGWRRLNEATITRGVSDCRWPGRLERVRVDDQREVWLDAAHNPQAAEALARFLARNESGYCLLFGALEDKDVGGALPLLAARASHVVLTEPASPRAVPAARLTRWVESDAVTVEPNLVRALDAALDLREARVVVCGSIYLIGEVRRLLRDRFGVPEAAVDVDITAGYSR